MVTVATICALKCIRGVSSHSITNDILGMINENGILTVEAWKTRTTIRSQKLGASGMKYTCNGLGAVEAANIKHAARIFANRVAHQKYGPQGRCRKLRVRNH
jgi:hypothetical protein